MKHTQPSAATRKFRSTCGATRRRGSALIPALLILSLLAMLGLSMLSAGLDGSKNVNYQSDEYRLTSAVESLGILTAETLWSGYLTDSGGAAGSIDSFRGYMDGLGLTAPVAGTYDPDTPPAWGSEDDSEFHDVIALLDLPATEDGAAFNHVNVDGIVLARRDDLLTQSTHLYIVVQASTTRGAGMVNPVLNRAIQMVYTIEPGMFEGFDYGILANNVNCIFCHAQVDSVDRFFNTDPDDYGTFDRVKVGTLESLMIRHKWEVRPGLSDFDADSRVAGSIYVRGHAVDQGGVPISTWDESTFMGFEFDSNGLIVQNVDGSLVTDFFVPAGDPPGPGENLYLNYPREYSDMPDGALPTSFPPPIPDDGGIDPNTGQPNADVAHNRRVDPEEFYKASLAAEGSIIAGTINVSAPDFVIDTTPEYAAALFDGNQAQLQSGVTGNVILSGTAADPIVIDGTVAIDGDLLINGYVKGQGSLLVSGNIYVPTDLKYLDGRVHLEGDAEGSPSGPRTFGIAQDGTSNALALAAGGNVMIGDYLKPATLGGSFDEGFTYDVPDQYEYISGDAAPDGQAVGEWSFALTEMALFNRKEWARSQLTLPGPDGEPVDNVPPSLGGTNPLGTYDPEHTPRYYQFGPGDTIPIYNKGAVYYDIATGSWFGDEDVPLHWDADKLTLIDPDNLTPETAPYLVDGTGNPVATITNITSTDGWLDERMQKLAIEYFEGQRAENTPMEIDGLIYTNNAIFGIVSRADVMRGQLIVNGSLVCADLGLLTPGYHNPGGTNSPSNVVGGSPYAVGLQLNYDKRLKNNLNVINPMSVTMKRTLWNPMANML